MILLNRNAAGQALPPTKLFAQFEPAVLCRSSTLLGDAEWIALVAACLVTCDRHLVATCNLNVGRRIGPGARAGDASIALAQFALFPIAKRVPCSALVEGASGLHLLRQVIVHDRHATPNNGLV